MQHSILAIELCLRLDAVPAVHARLRELLRSHPAEASFETKWRFHTRCAQLLAENLGAAERGCWDYFDNHERAVRDFDMWVKGMTTREGSRRAPSGPAESYRGSSARYFTFTMAYLLLQGAPCDLQVRQQCHIPDGALWTRNSLHRVLHATRFLNFASVRGDVAYLLPRDDDWGLTTEDLAEEKFAYLRTLT